MSDECQSRINGLGEMLSSRLCQRKAVETLDVICVHEHITTVTLCRWHVKRIETEAQCPTCALKSNGEHRHLNCRLRVLALVSGSDKGEQQR